MAVGFFLRISDSNIANKTIVCNHIVVGRMLVIAAQSAIYDSCTMCTTANMKTKDPVRYMQYTMGRASLYVSTSWQARNRLH